MRGTLRQIVVIASTFFVIIVNALANILPINGQNTGVISDSFQVYFVPAGYVFSIWGLIYLLLIGFSFYQALKDQRDSTLLDTVGWLYILGSLANIAWILLWHYNFPVISVAAMLTLLISLIAVYLQIKNALPTLTRKQYVLLKLPFSVYLGWISVATIANVTIALYVLNWDGLGIAPEVWSAIMIVIAGLLTMIMLIREKDYAYFFVIVWALIGIGIKFQAVLVIVGAASIVIAVTTVIALVLAIKRTQVLTF